MSDDTNLGGGMMRSLHPDLNAFATPGGLFDVSSPELEQNIGRLVQFKNSNLKHSRDYQIIGVQRIYDGSIAYRVQGATPFWYDGTYGADTFGRPARPEEVVFLDAPTPVTRRAYLFACYAYIDCDLSHITIYRDRGASKPYFTFRLDDPFAPERTAATVVIEFHEKHKDITILTRRWFMLEWID